jgi:hypothetical protein
MVLMAFFPAYGPVPIVTRWWYIHPASYRFAIIPAQHQPNVRCAMKRILFLVLLFSLSLIFITCSDDAPTSQTPTTGAATAVGISAGTKSETTIGAAGGTVRSSDSLLMLIIPPGALSLETAISIEPITNTAPGGIGRSYRLLPSGLTFAQPAVLSIRYGSTTLSPSSLVIAWQGSDNIWQGMIDASDVSTDLQVVAAAITHFTDFALYRRWFIVPDTFSVKVRQSASLVVYTTDLPDVGDSTTLSPLPNPYAIAAAEVTGWAVEHLPGGNEVFGTIAGAGASAAYTAPNTVPDENPVEVEATIDRSSEGQPDLEVTALVNITDDGGGGTGESTWEMDWEFIDSLTCSTDPVNGQIHRALVIRGVDTIVIGPMGGVQDVISSSGEVKSITVKTIGKCPDLPDHNWTQPEITKQPSVTPAPGGIGGGYFEPIGSSPTHLVVSIGSTYQYGIARHKDQYPGSNFTNESLGAGFFGFTARFRLPLSNPSTFDTTYVKGESLGLKYVETVHATLRKLH